MTIKQTFLKTVYPFLSLFTRLIGKNTQKLSSNTMANTSFYNLSARLNNGSILHFSTLKGKKVVLVNTASECGYTKQYDDLQKLYEKNKNDMILIGFPANDFGAQEKGSDEAIAEFCRVNFGVNFPLVKKSTVIKSPGQHDVYRWLTNAADNGWNDKAPGWNFCKYVVDENGNLTNFFESSIEPMGTEIKHALQAKKVVTTTATT